MAMSGMSGGMSAPETKPAMGGAVMRKKMFRTTKEKREAMRKDKMKDKKEGIKEGSPEDKKKDKMIENMPVAAKVKLMGKY